nr:MAG TPA: hypothetical protein [Bacteriophage sp.]
MGAGSHPWHDDGRGRRVLRPAGGLGIRPERGLPDGPGTGNAGLRGRITNPNNNHQNFTTMAKREKKVIITGVSREAADEAFAAYAKADAQSAKITADIELQCAKIREKYASKLAELEGEKEKAFDTLQAYATENQAELFTRKKSLEMAHGVIGFRTGTPKLKTLKGFTWASALQLVKEFLPGYVRQTEEIAKDKLLADRDVEDMAPQMAKCGISVSQDETFYVEPKKEDAA